MCLTFKTNPTCIQVVMSGRGPLKEAGFDRQDCVFNTALFVLELIDVTCTLLLLNPDFTTAWNVRYVVFVSGEMKLAQTSEDSYNPVTLLATWRSNINHLSIAS